MRCKVLWLQAICMCIIKIMPGAEGQYDVTIGAGTVVDPNARIIAQAGPISIGGGCVIEAQVTIINRNSGTLTIGQGNVFHAGCTVESPRIGNANVFGANSFVGNSVTVANACVIGAGCRVTNRQLSDGTVINC